MFIIAKHNTAVKYPCGKSVHFYKIVKAFIQTPPDSFSVMTEKNFAIKGIYVITKTAAAIHPACFLFFSGILMPAKTPMANRQNLSMAKSFHRS